jgi:SNF2 family DNA or RNA helicase
VTIFSDAMEHIDRETERRLMAHREEVLLRELELGRLNLDLLKVPLYPYQMRGALFVAYRGRCILGDDMGLGKTIMTMAGVELLVRERSIERVLVVAPASVKYQWETEIQRCTDRPVQVIEGANKTRQNQYSRPTFYRLTNYELVLRDLDQLNAWQPDLIVLDEAQRIKNWESKISRAVKRLRSRYALVLTGTPLENKLEELYSIVQFVDDRRLGPAFQFLHDHRVLDDAGNLKGYRNLDKIREKLGPILLRRTRVEVLSQLPERTDNTLYVEMTESQRVPYQEQQVTLAQLLSKKYLSEIDRRRILACIANMRMLCDSTFLYDKQTNVSPKLEEFAELMSELLSPAEPHKVVVFSQGEGMLRKAAEVLDGLKIGYVLLHGSVPSKDRRELLERFAGDPNCRVFLSTDAGGTGLNLQTADTVINLEAPWNPAVLEQRIARVHRLGQPRPVQVINLVTRDSIEERVLRTLGQKRSLFDGVFEGTADEVNFEALGQLSFLNAVREMVVGEETVAAGAVPAAPVADPRHALLQAGVQMLEALAEMVANGTLVASVPDGGDGEATRELLRRGALALQALVQGLAGPGAKAKGTEAKKET